MFRPQRLSVLIVTDPRAEQPDGSCSTASSACSRRRPNGRACSTSPASATRSPPSSASSARRCTATPGGRRAPSSRACPATSCSSCRRPRLPTSSGEIVGLQERRVVRVFEVPEPVGLWTTVLVYFPRNRFTAELPERLADIVADAYGADAADVRVVRVGELARPRDRQRAPPDRRPPRRPRRPRADDRRAVDLVDRPPAHRRSSASSVRRTGTGCSTLAGAVGPGGLPGRRRAGAGGRRPPPHRRGARPATSDLVVALGHDLDAAAGGVADARVPTGHADGAVRAAPAARPPRLRRPRRAAVHVPTSAASGCTSTTSASAPRRGACSTATAPPTSIDAFVGLVRGVIESDGFNRLVARRRPRRPRRGDDPRLRQVPAPDRLPVQPAVRRGHAGATRPSWSAGSSSCSRPASTRAGRAGGGPRRGGQDVLRAQIVSALDAIPSLDEDRICRSFLTLIEATTRTNFFRGADRRWRSSSTRRRSPSCRCRDRRSRSGCAARGSRACTCAAGRSPAVGCAGATAARTSAPRCSA